MRKLRFGWPTIEAQPLDEPSSPLFVRMLWLAGIWVASVGVLLAVAMVVRWALKS